MGSRCCIKSYAGPGRTMEREGSNRRSRKFIGHLPERFLDYVNRYHRNENLEGSRISYVLTNKNKNRKNIQQRQTDVITRSLYIYEVQSSSVFDEASTQNARFSRSRSRSLTSHECKAIPRKPPYCCQDPSSGYHVDSEKGQDYHSRASAGRHVLPRRSLL